MEQLSQLFDLEEDDVIQVSAKSGFGVEELFPAIIDRIPPPDAEPKGDFRALLFDSWFDDYRGVISLIRVRQLRFVFACGCRGGTITPLERV
jgi:GTP-binding protein LepA